MARIPSIHITEVGMVNVLKKIFKTEGPIKWDIEPMAKRILELAKTESVPSRSVVVSNEKLARKTEKMKLSSRSDTGRFAEILLLTRRRLKHRGIVLIKPGEQEWFNLKEACSLATEFCNEFGMDLKEGYKNYIEIGLSKMQKYSVFKFKTLHSAICTFFEAKIELQTDKTPNETKKAYKTFNTIIADKIGYIDNNYEEIPEKYVCFKKAKDEAERMGIKTEDYIRAQFHAFEWRSAIPDPMQLYGIKAIERAKSYCYEMNITVRSHQKKVNFGSIKEK